MKSQFKYTIEYDKFNDYWVVCKRGKELERFSADNKAGAEKLCQDLVEFECQPKDEY